MEETHEREVLKPPRKLVVEFTKMSGAGNDFVVIDNRFYHFSSDELCELARRVCRRRLDIGADGLLALEAAGSAEQHFRMRYVNADGAVGTMCGNGARCLARYAFDAGVRHRPVRFMTDAGAYSAVVLDESVRLLIPMYKDVSEIPADAAGPNRHFVWTGTEHLVVFCEAVELVDVLSLGERLRHTNPPKGANVNFVEVSNGGLKIRTFEKGVEGETLACGTGATAAAVIARLTGRVSEDEVRVRMRGGDLLIGFDSDGTLEYLEGPAENVFRGTFEV